MKTHSFLNTVSLVLWLGTLASTGYGAESTQDGAPIEGTWRWTFTMPDGTITRPRLVLEAEDGHLTGTTSFRPGNEASITNVSWNGQQLSFQVVRRRDNRDIITTYQGTWSGKTIRGQVESNWDGTSRTYPWEAQRNHEGAEGVWRWITTVRGRQVSSRIKLEQEGEVLTGSVPGSGRGARRVRLSRGSIKDGEIYFEIERGAGASRVVTIYKGTQSGDTIRGTIETLAAGRKLETAWVAHRDE